MKQKRTLILTVKVFGAIAALALFIFNIALFVQKDSKTGALSFNTPQAKANVASEEYYYNESEFIAGEGIDMGEDEGGGEGDGMRVNEELRQLVCVKGGVNIVYPLSKSGLNIIVGSKLKCRKHTGSTCDPTKQTSCS